jgi:hypothetical protein
MEETIKNYLKRSFLSLIPRGRRNRTAPARIAFAPAVSITRLQSGLPQSFPTAISADDGHRHRRRSSCPGYTRGRYLARPRHAAGISQRMFRIT